MRQAHTLTAAFVGCAMMLSATASADQLYTFTFTADRLMEVSGVLSGSHTSPVEAGILNGARQFDDGATEYATYLSGPETEHYLTWRNTTEARLGQFNFWGLGEFAGYSAEPWGEDFLALGWSDYTTTLANWVAEESAADPMSGQVYPTPLLSFQSLSGYADALPFADPTAPGEFTFTLSLADEFDGWYLGNEGQLVFWFGGTAINPDNTIAGVYQGNMLLSGHRVDPVPEPASLLLYGIGVTGLAAWRRREK